ncbi:HEAT repeat domain-containing protein [Methylobacterium sp. WL9]|uniref:HEAT repeat domain-containing protein n=1 Tax=Methylobacterium sp. WL9 TaxID=2603898 RepID=UPI00164F3E7A|nr:HEAT repeat domain-containing protein [Methylobacterium sp. WL9]
MPDRLVDGASSYSLHAFPPILPPDDPRWKRCRFAPGHTTANQRGYGATWTIDGERLLLTSFGGSVDIGWPAQGRVQIQMRDVHEVDGPIPATWISGDLFGASVECIADPYREHVPCRFRVFRVVSGRVIAAATFENEEHITDIDFAYVMAERTASHFRTSRCVALRIANPPVPGLADGLAMVSETAPSQLADLLWQAGAADLPVLISALPHAIEADVARWIAYALGRIGPDADVAIPALLDMLRRAQDKNVLKAAAYALGGIGAAVAPRLATVVALLERRCGHATTDQVGTLIRQLRPMAAEAVKPLIDALLITREPATRYQIAYALGKIGASAVPPLVTVLGGASDQQRIGIARALEEIGPDARAALAGLLDALEATQDDRLRRAIAEALAAIGLRARVSLEPMRATFRQTADRDVMIALAAAMATLGCDAVEPLMQDFVDAHSASSRVALARALGSVGTSAASAAVLLAEAAETSRDGDLIVELADALLKIGAPASRTATVQVAALRTMRDAYDVERMLGRMVPGVVPSASAIGDLTTLLHEWSHRPFGRRMADLLGAMGNAAYEPLLSALAAAPPEQARVLIVHALGRIGATAAAAIDDVMDALSKAASDQVRLQIIDDLRRLGKPNSGHLYSLIVAFDKSSFLPVLWRLGLVLAEIGSPALAPLIERLKATHDADRQRAIGNALGRLGTKAADAIPVIQSVMQSTSDTETRKTLAGALRQIAVMPN